MSNTPLNDAKAAIQAGDYERAVELLKEFTRSEPDNFQARVMLGVAYGQMEDFSSSVAGFERALMINPNNVSALRNLARVHERRGAIEQAQNVIDRALQLDPDDEDSRRVHDRLHTSESTIRSTGNETTGAPPPPPPEEEETVPAGPLESSPDLSMTAIDGTRASSRDGTLEVSSIGVRFIHRRSLLLRSTEREIPIDRIHSIRRRPAPILSQFLLGGFLAGPKVQIAFRDTTGHLHSFVVRKADCERILRWFEVSQSAVQLPGGNFGMSSEGEGQSRDHSRCPECGEPIARMDSLCMACGAQLGRRTSGGPPTGADRRRRSEMAPYFKLGIFHLVSFMVIGAVLGYAWWSDMRAARADEAIAAGDELVEDNRYNSAIEKYGEARELGDERADSRIEQAKQKQLVYDKEERLIFRAKSFVRVFLWQPDAASFSGGVVQWKNDGTCSVSGCVSAKNAFGVASWLDWTVDFGFDTHGELNPVDIDLAP